jgi:quinol monooxygenase YgiN
MAEIRVLVQSALEGLADQIPGLLDAARAARTEPGCLQYELFRSAELPEDFALLQLWENERAFDDHWRKQLDRGVSLLGDLRQVQAPYHFGSPQSPRRHGQNGVEFSKRVVTQGVDNVWMPRDESLRSEFVRWPATLPVRFISQNTSDPSTPGQTQQFYDESRAEEGCLQFEAFRSIEFPENTVTLELWDSPRAIEKHWLNRLTQRMYPSPDAPMPAPRPEPPARRYGQAGSEWSQSTWYALVEGVWMPEDPDLRTLAIRWA